MSHHNSPFFQRKKIQKYNQPPVSLPNSQNKLKRVTSGSSRRIAETENEHGIQKPDSSNLHSNNQNDFITETEISNSDFNGKKLFGIKTGENSQQLRTSQTDRKLGKENDLVRMLGKQLYLAESQMEKMQVAISKFNDRSKDKDEEIVRLRRKVKEWEARFKSQETVHKKEYQQVRKQVEDSEHLHKRCLMLEHKICEMEKFLADYGLVWVGDTDKNRNEMKSIENRDYMKSCYAQLVSNIEELNMAVGKGEVHVHREKGGSGASFKTSSCMSLKFYKNGFVVQNGHLRDYDNPDTMSFIRDILDGYFPSELQKSYPQGVPFKVEDHRTETFLDSRNEFPGHGYKLGKIFPKQNYHGNIRNLGCTQNTNSAGSSRYSCVTQRENFHSSKPIVPNLVNSNAKSTKSKSFCETQPTNMMQLRSQILASHNNNCSESHLQSHINAELGLNSSRIEKKRELATKDAEYKISLRDETLMNSKFEIRSRSQRQTSGSGTSCHSSTERSPDRISSGYMESTRNADCRSRSRSASLPSRRLRIRSLSKGRTTSGNTNANTTLKTNDNAKVHPGMKQPRITRSATVTGRKNSMAPLLHQINEPSGRSGELRLKVRSLNGCVVYLVHLRADDNVARLYDLLDTCMNIQRNRSRGYRLVVSGYEPKRLDQLCLSLKEYGILRDSVLHIINE